MKRRTASRPVSPSNAAYARRASRESAFAAAMRRGRFELTSMGGGMVAWAREEGDVELFALSPRGDGSAPLKGLTAPVALHVQAPALGAGNEDLLVLHFPSVTAMLASLRRRRVR